MKAVERWRRTCRALELLSALSLCPHALGTSPLRCPPTAACSQTHSRRGQQARRGRSTAMLGARSATRRALQGMRRAYLPPALPVLMRRGGGSGVRVSGSEPEESLLKPACEGATADAHQADRNAGTRGHGGGAREGARGASAAAWARFAAANLISRACRSRCSCGAAAAMRRHRPASFQAAWLRCGAGVQRAADYSCMCVCGQVCGGVRSKHWGG